MISICHYMQDGEVKGTEMPISFDVCSSVVSHFFIPQPPPPTGFPWPPLPPLQASFVPPFKNPSYAPGLSSFPPVIDLTASLPWVAWRVCSASPLYPPFLHFSTMILIALSFPRGLPCSLLQMVIHSAAALRSRLNIHLTIPNKSLWLIFFIRS